MTNSSPLHNYEGKGSGAKAKLALNREILRTTGTGKPRSIFPSPGEFATILSPPLPDNFRLILRRLSMRFPGRAESIGPMWFPTKTKVKTKT